MTVPPTPFSLGLVSRKPLVHFHCSAATGSDRTRFTDPPELAEHERRSMKELTGPFEMVLEDPRMTECPSGLLEITAGNSLVHFLTF